MTDAPIYLVSACGSGEEFVAAFRRYADKHGLFVPIAEPLASGRRGRFAVTLRDGGVMIEGEADIVSSARAASVVHGRVGMTLKFVEPDPASKTMLGELEKARLSMRPPPPSVAPRPATIPAEPRPVPPAAQGRIDAVNALAECVAIGAPDVLEAFALTALAPSKPGMKFVVPPIAPGRAKPATTPPPARPPTAPVPAVKPLAALAPAGRPPTAQVPVVKPTTAQVPTVKPTTAQVAQGRAVTAQVPGPASPPLSAMAAVVDRGPTSETMIVALPPEPDSPGPAAEPRTDVDLQVAVARTGTRPGAPPAPPPPPSSPMLAATMSAVPLPAGPSSSAPTDIGAAIVDLALVAEPPDRVAPDPAAEAALVPEPTTSPEVQAVEPPEPTTSPDGRAVDADARASVTAIVEATSEEDDGSARTQVHAGVPPREPSGGAREPARIAAVVRDTPTNVRAQPFPTMRGAPIDLTQTLRTPPPDMEEIRALLASDRRPMTTERAPEVEIAEPTDLSMAPPPPPQEPAGQRGRKTAIGVAVIPAAVASVSGEMTSVVPGELAAGDGTAVAPPGFAPPLAPPRPARDPAAPLARSSAPSISGGPSSLPVPPPLGLDEPLPGGASVIVDDASLAAADEPTGADRVVEDDDPIDLTAPIRAGGKLAAPVEEPTPSEYWTISPGGQLAAKPKDPNRARSNSSAPIAIAPASSGTTTVPVRARSASTAPPSGPVAALAPAAPPSGPVAALAPAAPPSGPVAQARSATPGSGPLAAPAGSIAPPGGAAPASGPVAAPVAAAPGSGPTAAPTATGSPGSGPSAAPAAIPAAGAPVASGPVATAHAAGAAPIGPAAGLPSGDWLIALDPGAPDGWSAPFETVSPQLLADDAPAPDEPAHRPSLPANEMPVLEPKVQIDPTLIEPLAALPADETYSRPPAPTMAMYGGPAGFAPMPTPMPMPGVVPMAMPMPPTPPPFGAAHGPPAYPMDPAYQMVPIATLPGPRAVTATGSGLGDPRYASDPALPVQSNRRRIIIVLATAIVAVALGIVVLAVVTRKHDAAPPAGPGESHQAPAPGLPAEPPPPVVPAHTAEATHADVAPGAIAPRATGPGSPEAVAPVAAATACFADVTSVPAGAEIVVGEADVLGTTPQKVTLPCGDKVELTIRKPHLVAVTRTITPTTDGVKLRVALGKQMFQVKVSSTPPGATITLAGKALGVTPTTVRVPAFEASTLSIAKDGYAAEAERVAPRSNGTAVHSTLKRLERRPR